MERHTTTPVACSSPTLAITHGTKGELVWKRGKTTNFLERKEALHAARTGMMMMMKLLTLALLCGAGAAMLRAGDSKAPDGTPTHHRPPITTAHANKAHAKAGATPAAATTCTPQYNAYKSYHLDGRGVGGNNGEKGKDPEKEWKECCALEGGTLEGCPNHKPAAAKTAVGAAAHPNKCETEWQTYLKYRGMRQDNNEHDRKVGLENEQKDLAALLKVGLNNVVLPRRQPYADGATYGAMKQQDRDERKLEELLENTLKKTWEKCCETGWCPQQSGGGGCCKASSPYYFKCPTK